MAYKEVSCTGCWGTGKGDGMGGWTQEACQKCGATGRVKEWVPDRAAQKSGAAEHPKNRDRKHTAANGSPRNRIKSKDWNWVAAIIGGFSGGFLALGHFQLEGPIAVMAAFVSAVIGGRFYKQIIALAAVALIGYVLLNE